MICKSPQWHSGSLDIYELAGRCMYRHCIAAVLWPRMSFQHLEGGLGLYTAPFGIWAITWIPYNDEQRGIFWEFSRQELLWTLGVLWHSLDIILRQELGNKADMFNGPHCSWGPPFVDATSKRAFGKHPSKWREEKLLCHFMHHCIKCYMLSITPIVGWQVATSLTSEWFHKCQVSINLTKISSTEWGKNCKGCSVMYLIWKAFANESCMRDAMSGS